MNKFFQKISFLFIIVILLFLYLGCSLSQSSSSKSEIPTNLVNNFSLEKIVDDNANISKKIDLELEKNKKLWREKNITDYDLNARLFKGGTYTWAYPVLIKVRNGQANSIEILDEKFKEIPIEEAIGGYRELDTIEKMFDYIQKGLDGNADISVKYDKKLGYPKDMRVNYHTRGTDQWQTMKINKFEIID